jgi:hypothetical protein
MFHARYLLTQSNLSLIQLLRSASNNSKTSILNSSANNSFKATVNSRFNYSNQAVEQQVSTLNLSESCVKVLRHHPLFNYIKNQLINYFFVVKRLKELENTSKYLRVVVDSGGCSGLEYKFSLDSSIAKEDK